MPDKAKEPAATEAKVSEAEKQKRRRTKLIIILTGIVIILLIVANSSSSRSSFGNNQVDRQGEDSMVVINLHKGEEWKEVKVPPQHRIKFSATKNALINIRINHTGSPKMIGPGMGYMDLGHDVEVLEFQLENDQSLDVARVVYNLERL